MLEETHSNTGIKIKTIKTTVTIPTKVLDTLQLYIAKTPDANLRDQSSVVILALVEYLNKRMDEKYKIDPTRILKDTICKKFHVIESKSQ